ncbi:MAG TPA: hypothetical protein VEZ14_09830 [Dehalococcoidia bacterium]|nr:hypothetical protein [Dehalococcoidia bacterium]
MSWLKKLRRDREEGAPAADAPATPDCPHYVLVPRWDNVADMGKDELATSFRCEACAREFSPSEAQALRDTEAERVRNLVS